MTLLPAYLKKAAALLAVATVLGGCSGQPSDAEPTQTALAGEVETTTPTTTTTTSTTTTTELLQLAGEIVINLKRILNGKQNVWKYQNGEEKSDSDGREKDV